MIKALPIFPLNTVVFPNDPLNLHIFEPRYRQMIRDCEESGGTFGMPAFIDNEVQEVGTEVKILEIVERYDDGRLDIRTIGVAPFLMSALQNPWPGKLYAGASAQELPVSDTSSVSEKILLLRQVAELYDLMGMSLNISPEEKFISFQVGHKVGLSLRQEYALLTLASEPERIQYLLDHLSRNIPVVREMERTKQRIRMNGHFRNFDPLDF